ncbi:MAG: lipid kinase [Candidatus Sungbacteria bacterium]|nr:lipid kinase [Candidatus Sungbacteria bacterium]
MKKTTAISLGVILVIFLAAVFMNSGVSAQGKPCRVEWSRYTGWEPWGYMEASGILKKHAQKHKANVELHFASYGATIDSYASGNACGIAITNMDVLIGPALGGVDSTALIVGDFSNGNDGVVLRNGATLADLKGRRAYIVDDSVSTYLLYRGLEIVGGGVSPRDVTLLNTDEADIVAAFRNDSAPNAAIVTWNPHLMLVRNDSKVKMVFDSSKIPGEIIDMLVVRTDTPDNVKRALVGAWYETMAVMSGRGPEAKKAREFMAKQAGATPAEFEAQLATTAMFYRAADAAAFTKSPELKRTMDLVRTFSHKKGLYKGKSPDHVGIQFPDGSVMGNSKNVKLRFNSTYVQLAAEGKL